MQHPQIIQKSSSYRTATTLKHCPPNNPKHLRPIGGGVPIIRAQGLRPHLNPIFNEGAASAAALRNTCRPAAERALSSISTLQTTVGRVFCAVPAFSALKK